MMSSVKKFRALTSFYRNGDAKSLHRPFFISHRIVPRIGEGLAKNSALWAEPIVALVSLKSYQYPSLHILSRLLSPCVQLWDTERPDGNISLVHSSSMRQFNWGYTQFSQFNADDSLLLVSGVYLGPHHSSSGEIAVISLGRNHEILQIAFETLWTSLNTMNHLKT